MASATQKLEEKLKKSYGEKIYIACGNKRKNDILNVGSLVLEEAEQKRNIKGDDINARLETSCFYQWRNLVGWRDFPYLMI